MSAPKLDTLLVTYPIEPAHAHVLDRLRKAFKTVHVYPGEDGSGTPGPYPVVLPPPEVYAEADAILAFVMPENLHSFEQTPKLKLWQALGSGTAHITDTPYFHGLDPTNPLIMSNLAGLHAVSIGEHVMMTILMHFHKMKAVMATTNAQRWAGPTELGGLHIRELRGQTIGVIAYGHIAREIARLAAAFGMRVIACTRDGQAKTQGGFHLEGTGDRSGSLPAQYYNMTDKASLAEFLGECDVVVNMLPSSKATSQFVGRNELTLMKDDALLVNAGRGDTVDTAALLEALQATNPVTGKTGTFQIGGACLDVTDPEPLPNGHPLFTMPNVIITPHCSYASEQLYERVVDLLIQNKERLERGEGALNALRGKGE